MIWGESKILELMPAFGPDGPHGQGPNGGINILQVLAWVNDAHFARGISYISKLQEAVREGIQALDHAGLVITSGGRDGTWTAVTRLGQTALAAGTVAYVDAEQIVIDGNDGGHEEYELQKFMRSNQGWLKRLTPARRSRPDSQIP